MPDAVSFYVQGKRFAGECYGDPSRPPVIALHGWLDNCRSFFRLAPLLSDSYVLALDMAGHGFTEHRSADASYHIWDDVREVLLIADHFGWRQFSLLGHSRGAIIAVMIAAIAPERIKKLALIDGFWPQVMKDDEAPSQLGSFVHRILYEKRHDRIYPDREAMVEMRCKSGFGMSREAARVIIDRNTEAVEGGYRWVTDHRLMLPSPFMLTEAEALAFLSAIRSPGLLVLANNGMGKNLDYLKPRYEAIAGLGMITLQGGHHLHMEGAETGLAHAINDFLWQ